MPYVVLTHLTPVRTGILANLYRLYEVIQPNISGLRVEKGKTAVKNCWGVQTDNSETENEDVLILTHPHLS